MSARPAGVCSDRYSRTAGCAVAWTRGQTAASLGSPRFAGWALEHGLNSAGTLVAELDRRFEQVLYRTGPYMFAELAGTSVSDEQRAIDAGEIQPMRIDYVGRSNGGYARL